MPEQTAKNTKRVLLINDLAGYGKVALSAMIPVFSHLRYDTCNLPTKTVYAMIRRGELKKQNVGRLFRIPKSYLIEYLGIEDARQ